LRELTRSRRVLLSPRLAIISPVGTVVRAVELECEVPGSGLVVALNRERRRPERGPTVASNGKRRRVTKTGARMSRR
jgi:hypothetical protein